MKPGGKNVSIPVLVIGGASLLAIGFFAGFSVRGKTSPASSGENAASAATASRQTDAEHAPARQAAVADAAPAVDLTTRRLTRDDTALVTKTPMTPELARTLLAKVKAESKDIGERALLCACILHALSESGHVDEAWKLLEESPGSVRVMEIGMLFQTDKLPLETLLTRLRELTDPDDRTNAIRAILSSRSANIAQLDFNTFPLESESDQRAAFGAFVSVLHGAAGEKDAATSEAVLGKLVDLVGTGKIDGKHLYVVLDGDYGVDPFRKWEMLRPVEGGMSPADSERFRVQGVTSMVRADMDKAMELLCSDPQSRYSVPILNKAVSTIYQLDPAHANKWMTENLSRIDPATGQRVIVSVGQAAIRSGELATARQWAEHLLNPGVKEQLLKQIDAAEVPATNGSR